jgi:single-stranded DNA-specific DHH superfamily exonuclease
MDGKHTQAGRQMMNPKIDADGETWVVALDKHEPHPGVAALVFSCLTNTQRPWHVVELPASEVTGSGVEALGEDYLQSLFVRSQTMDYLHGDPLDAQQLSFDAEPPPTALGR